MIDAQPSSSPVARPRQRARDNAYLGVLTLMLMLFVGIFTQLAWQQHAALRTHKADLGQMDLAIWNSAHGRLLEEIKGDSLSTRLTDHAEPILILISPIFWLWDDVRALLLLQVLAVALAAIPLFALARDALGPVAALTLAAAWLLNPSLQAAVLSDFHAIPLAVPLILWSFHAIEARHWRQFVLAASLLAAVKEEAALLAAGLGLWALWRTRHDTTSTGRRAGLMLLLAGSAWFALATFVIIPAHGATVHHSPASIYFRRYTALGDTPAAIFKNSLLHPQRLGQILAEPARQRYLAKLVAGFGFLPLPGIESILLALPLILANTLSSYPAQFYGDFHYSAPLIPYMAVAAIWGLQRITQHRPTWLRHLLLIWLIGWAGFMYTHAGRGPGGGAYAAIRPSAHARLLPRFLTQIPRQAAVTATAALEPHLTHRRFIYQFPYGQQAEWALLDVTGDTSMAPGDLYEQVQSMLTTDWGVVDAADGYLLLHRGEANRVIPPAFYDFARTPGAARNNTPPLQFLGLQAHPRARWRLVDVQSQWQVGATFQAGTVRPWLVLRAPDGELLYTYDQSTPPALIWYPPTRWQKGDILHLRSTGLALPHFWVAAAGVVHGPDPSQAAHRLPRELVAPQLPPADANDTLGLVALWQWQARHLRRYEPTLLTSSNLAAQLQPDRHDISASFRAQDGHVYRMTAHVPQNMPAAGQPLDFWLHWQDALPPHVQSFVHLRHQGQIVAQDDGPRRLFWLQPPQQGGNDWREVQIPGDNVASGQRVELVIGLYQPATGQRLALLGPDGQPAGTELVLASWLVPHPPVPDQSCALIPATCVSQPQ